VRVELHERERPMPPSQRAELGERVRVIAAEGEREDAGVEKRRQCRFDLAVRALGVARGDGTSP
jgi:hypothetical protein